MTSVDFDDDMNVFGSGYQCTLVDGAKTKVCDGIVAMFDADTGAVLWENSFTDVGALFFVKWDREDGAIYVAGTTTYGGDAKGAKDHEHCPEDTCSVVMRLSSTDGSAQWVRTIKGSPRWGVFDQSGGLELADDEKDGPYLYVALDDTGEGGEASLQRGTPYGGCLALNGQFTPEFHVLLKKVVTLEDCNFYDDSGASEFISREDPRARAASTITKNVSCGRAGNGGRSACLMKYHKHTGLPIWAVDVPPVAGLVPAADGRSVSIAGWYYPGRAPASFDGVVLPGYLREGGLGSQTSGVYNAKVNAEDGRGEFVIHSGGGAKDRLYDLVGDLDGNLYNIGYHMNLVTQWGGNLKTVMVEESPTTKKGTSNASSAIESMEAIETHMYVSKLAAATQEVPSCLTTCDSTTDDAVVDSASCFIDGKCYAAGDDGHMFGKGCFVCDPVTSQTEWTAGLALGLTQCFVDNRCVGAGEALFYQRRTWSAKIYSDCQVCDPGLNAEAWTVRDGFIVDEPRNPPDDCMSLSTATAGSSTEGSTAATPDEIALTLPTSVPTIDNNLQVTGPSEQSSSRPTSTSPAEKLMNASVTTQDSNTSAHVKFSSHVISRIVSALIMAFVF